jgi:multiple sugar transport system ATP-binding protein
VRNPQAFLMDEPLSNLDAKLRVQTRTTISRLQNQLGTTTVYVTHDQIEAMTLGDRVAVMRSGGVIQQVGSPEELYERPTNLFVAGFIGSPAMNFLPATLEDGQLRTPFGDVTLPTEVRAKIEEAGAGREVIVGIRPEHFEDAALVGDKKAQGLTFSAVVDVLESLGADEYAYFRLEGTRATARELEELAADAGAGDVPGAGEQVVARLDPASRAREGQKLELWFDPRRVHLFNPETGAHLTL